MSQLVAGWDVATVREIVADTLHNIVDPLVFDEAVSLIEEHKLAGRDVVDRVRVRRRGRRPHRRDARRRPGRRHAGWRSSTGATPARSTTTPTPRRRRARSRRWPSECGYDLDGVLRLQRLDHRRAHARGRRSPARGEPRQGAAQGRRRQRLAGPGLHQAGGAPLARLRSRAPRSPRSPSGARSPSAASSGPASGAAASAPERPPTRPPDATRGPTAAGRCQPLKVPAGTAYKREQNNWKQHVSRVPTRRSTLPTGR